MAETFLQGEPLADSKHALAGRVLCSSKIGSTKTVDKFVSLLYLVILALGTAKTAINAIKNRWSRTLTSMIFFRQPFRWFSHLLRRIANSFDADNFGDFERGTLTAGAVLVNSLRYLFAKTLHSPTENSSIYTILLFYSFPHLTRFHKPGRKRTYRLSPSPFSGDLQLCNLPRVRKRTPQMRDRHVQRQKLWLIWVNSDIIYSLQVKDSVAFTLSAKT